MTRRFEGAFSNTVLPRASSMCVIARGRFPKTFPSTR
jgi:hypothetical protein